MRVNWCGSCAGGALKRKSATRRERCIRKWDDEEVLDWVQQRLLADPSRLALRSMTANHSLGTVKAWMGATDFQIRQP